MAKLGRKTLFKPEILSESERMAGYGLIEEQIAHVLGISPYTLARWKRFNPEFLQALKKGEAIANERVVKSLYQRAIGYEYDEIAYEKSKPGGLGINVSKKEITSIKHTEAYKVKITTKQVVPDTTAQIFWLKNRMPDKWRDVQRHEHSGEIKGNTFIFSNITTSGRPVAEVLTELNSRLSAQFRK